MTETTDRSWRRWYSRKLWKERRRDQLTREPLCAYCIELDIVEAATVADHVEPHRGDWELFAHGALQSLCATCHSSVKQREEAGEDIQHFGTEGWPDERDFDADD